MALALGANATLAQEDGGAGGQILSAQTGGPRAILELSSSESPRFDGDAWMRTSRTGVTLLPSGRSGVGLSVGVTSGSGPALGLLAPYVPGAPMFDLGLHWRYELDGNYRVDVTAWRRVGYADAMSLIQSRDSNYGARVEMGLASGQLAANGFVADRGFVGLQLEGGARVTVRRSGGKPMLYYRNTF